MTGPAWYPESAHAGEVSYPPGGTYGPRIQRDVQIVAVEAGWVDVEVDGARHHFGAGVAFLLRPGRREFFRFATDAATRHAWVAGRGRGAPPELPPEPAGRPAWVPLDPDLDQLIRLTRAVYPPSRPEDGDVARALAHAAISWFCRAARLQTPTGGRAGHAAVARAVQHVRAHLGEPMGLEDLARAAAVSKEHLCRLFRAEHGVGPVRYLWSQRTAAALRLLEASGLPLKEIAGRCGFRSVYHFSRRIKAASGEGPAAYRARRWNAAQQEAAGGDGRHPPPASGAGAGGGAR